eukprot:scaffold207546_cov30-Tisochrysis_lutea.AAC.1
MSDYIGHAGVRLLLLGGGVGRSFARTTLVGRGPFARAFRWRGAAHGPIVRRCGVGGRGREGEGSDARSAKTISILL